MHYTVGPTIRALPSTGASVGDHDPVQAVTNVPFSRHAVLVIDVRVVKVNSKRVRHGVAEDGAATLQEYGWGVLPLFARGEAYIGSGSFIVPLAAGEPPVVSSAPCSGWHWLRPGEVTGLQCDVVFATQTLLKAITGDMEPLSPDKAVAQEAEKKGRRATVKWVKGNPLALVRLVDGQLAGEIPISTVGPPRAPPRECVYTIVLGRQP